MPHFAEHINIFEIFEILNCKKNVVPILAIESNNELSSCSAVQIVHLQANNSETITANILITRLLSEHFV